MRVFNESDLNYSTEDIIASINDELGFSLVRESGEGSGYFILGTQIKLYVDFKDEINIELRFPDSIVELSTSTSQAETYATAIESAIEIVNIIDRMTGGNINEENS